MSTVWETYDSLSVLAQILVVRYQIASQEQGVRLSAVRDGGSHARAVTVDPVRWKCPHISQRSTRYRSGEEMLRRKLNGTYAVVGVCASRASRWLRRLAVLECHALESII